MKPQDLATEAHRLRKLARMTQADVADRMVKSGRYSTLSLQRVSLAENLHEDTPGLNDLRVAIIEELGGKPVVGPVWMVEEKK